MRAGAGLELTSDGMRHLMPEHELKTISKAGRWEQNKHSMF